LDTSIVLTDYALHAGSNVVRNSTLKNRMRFNTLYKKSNGGANSAGNRKKAGNHQ
jgi:hypothetical protein